MVIEYEYPEYKKLVLTAYSKIKNEFENSLKTFIDKEQNEDISWEKLEEVRIIHTTNYKVTSKIENKEERKKATEMIIPVIKFKFKNSNYYSEFDYFKKILESFEKELSQAFPLRWITEVNLDDIEHIKLSIYDHYLEKYEN